MRSLTATAITTLVSLLYCSGALASRGLLQQGISQFSPDFANLAVPESAPTGFQASESAPSPLSSASSASAPQTTSTSPQASATTTSSNVTPTQLPASLPGAIAPSLAAVVPEPSSTANALTAQVCLVAAIYCTILVTQYVTAAWADNADVVPSVLSSYAHRCFKVINVSKEQAFVTIICLVCA